MEYRGQSSGLRTFLEHWGILFFVITALFTTQVLMFFVRLSGAMWIWFLVASFALMIVGGGLIGYAKLPVYRSGRFFTFGLKSVPAHLQGFYRWGWRVFLFGAVLSLCLLASGCGRSGTERKLVGLWGLNTNGTAVTITFADDHTLTMTFAGAVNRTQTGRWVIQGRRLIMEANSPRLYKETNRIAKLNDSTLVLEGHNRNEMWDRSFARVR